MATPDDRRYTDQHEWALVQGTDGTSTVVRVGITDHAQDALGDIVFVQLPAVGDEVGPGAPIGEVESTKSVSDVYAPVAGVVAAVNEALADAPETINADPYGAGRRRISGSGRRVLTAPPPGSGGGVLTMIASG
jgi:glycine cleavage system H protein